MKNKQFCVSFFVLFCALFAHSSDVLPLDVLKGKSVISGKAVESPKKSKKGVVVVFLSAVCPCSDSHVKELVDLAVKFPDYEFVGIHSNVDEGFEMASAYFKNVSLPFNIVRDDNANIADIYKANKTPHVFVMDNTGMVLYQGGVSSSSKIESADRKYLREALENITLNKTVKTPVTRTLGCSISRGA